MLLDEVLTKKGQPAVEAVRRYLDRHADRPLPRAELARMAGFSLPHFARLFKARTGESLAAYMLRRRLERAGRKLRMGAVDITEVALAAGYESHAAFSKAFKRRFGLSPSQFRRLPCPAATRLLTQGELA